MNIVIYDQTGRVIFSTVKNDIENLYIKEIEIPEGYFVKSINLNTNEPVFEMFPKTREQQQIDEIKSQINTILGIKESEWF